MTNLFDELQWRGLVSEATEHLVDALAKERVTAYIGFDPTASSLHVGSLLTVMGLARCLEFDRAGNPARIVNNAEWLASFDLLGFLRDTGKHFTVNYMLQKESVNRRLESEDGISFTEFSYLLLQARDYLELFDRFGCTLQMGGSDQWGNITAGIDLIRKLRATKTHGLVMPLVTTASGVKFGKTEAGTVWL